MQKMNLKGKSRDRTGSEAVVMTGVRGKVKSSGDRGK